jgi:hypothetical protein
MRAEAVNKRVECIFPDAASALSPVIKTRNELVLLRW